MKALEKDRKQLRWRRAFPESLDSEKETTERNDGNGPGIFLKTEKQKTY